MDYGSETTGYIRTIIQRHDFFFFGGGGIIAKLTHIFFHVYLNFLPVLHIVNSPKITKTFMYSVLTKMIKV